MVQCGAPGQELLLLRAILTHDPPSQSGHFAAWRLVISFRPRRPGVATCMLLGAAMICHKQPDLDRVPRSIEDLLVFETQLLVLAQPQCWFCGTWSTLLVHDIHYLLHACCHRCCAAMMSHEQASGAHISTSLYSLLVRGFIFLICLKTTLVV